VWRIVKDAGIDSRSQAALPCLDWLRLVLRSGRGTEHPWPRRYKSEYEIDLRAGHGRALRSALARYVSAARRAEGGARRIAPHPSVLLC